MTPLEQYQHLLVTKGISLQLLGIRDIALERTDALSAVEFLRKASIPILGGDVYVKFHTSIELAYANWHSDPKPNEATNDYFSRSCDATEKYIKDYPEPTTGKPLFVLVIK
jgi:hypothetical protein